MECLFIKFFFMKNRWLILFLLAISSGCSRNAITGRNQFSLYPDSDLQAMAFDQYTQFLRVNKVVDPTASHDAEMVQRVAQRLVTAITAYYEKMGLSEKLRGYEWEYHLVDIQRCKCLVHARSKIAVYAGLQHCQLKIRLNF